MRQLVLVFALLACSDSSGPSSIVGAYDLITVNGQSLPEIVAQDQTGTLEVTGGLVTLNADGTFSDQTDFRFTDPNDVVFTTEEVAVGTYTRNGDDITFDPSAGPNYSMTLSGRRLTQVLQGFTIVYER